MQGIIHPIPTPTLPLKGREKMTIIGGQDGVFIHPKGHFYKGEPLIRDRAPINLFRSGGAAVK